MSKKSPANDTPAESHAETASTALPGTQQLVIQSVGFIAPAPFLEGMPLTTPMASVLNQVLGENLRNNFAPKVKAAKEAAAKAHAEANPGEAPNDTLSAATLSELAAAFATYAASYEFNGKRPSRVVLDPVDREARKIAKSLVLELLRGKDIDTKTLPEGKLDELIDGALDRRPDIRAEAERRIAATKAVAGESLADLLG